MLGVVTEVTVKLIPKPACAQVVMASFASVEAAGNAVTQVIAAGMIPAGLEMMDRRATHMVEPFVRAGYDMDAQAILLCESDGTPEEVAHEIARMEAVFRDAGATRCQVSASEAERLKFWAGRKNAFPPRARVARLLLHGRHHPAPSSGARAGRHRTDGRRLRPALRQRLPCGRRQPAPADPVRFE